MNIKFIAMGLLTATVISTAAFADDMQQNTQPGTQGTAMSSDQAKNMGAMPIPQGTTTPATGATTTTTTTTTGSTATTGTTGTPSTTGTTGNTTQTGTY